jgi:hypothetical protein
MVSESRAHAQSAYWQARGGNVRKPRTPMSAEVRASCHERHSAAAGRCATAARMSVLQYRAGARALEILRRRGGLAPEDVSALVLPAIGPKWLVLHGIDSALVRAGFLEAAAQARRLLLFGASAGAWRGLAFASRDPARAIDALRDHYCLQHFTLEDSPEVISGAYRRLLHSVLSPDDLAHAAAHPRLDLAIAAVRARGLLARARSKNVQAASLGAAMLLNALGPKTQRLFFERVTFSTAHLAQRLHPLIQGAPGEVLALTVHNMLDAALASGTVPLYMQSVRDIASAPAGEYLDGGFSDYHLNREVPDDGITLLCLHQRRIVPTWTDKFLPWRKPARDWLSNVVLVHPTPEFIRALPGAKVPTRHDFKTHLHEPERRQHNWRGVADQGALLGELLLRDAQSGAIVSQAQPL